MGVFTESSTERDWAFYTPSIAALIGAETVFLYELLRHWVLQPSPERIFPSKLKEEGFIGVVVPQKDLLLATGFNVGQIEAMLKVLESIAWVQVRRGEDGEQICFLLGSYLVFSDQCRYPVMWAAEWLQELLLYVRAKAEEECGICYEDNSDDESQYIKLAYETTPAWRSAKVQAFMGVDRLGRQECEPSPTEETP